MFGNDSDGVAGLLEGEGGLEADYACAGGGISHLFELRRSIERHLEVIYPITTMCLGWEIGGMVCGVFSEVWRFETTKGWGRTWL